MIKIICPTCQGSGEIVRKRDHRYYLTDERADKLLKAGIVNFISNRSAQGRELIVKMITRRFLKWIEQN